MTTQDTAELTLEEVLDRYEAQGYTLPEGVTRELVAEHQELYGIDVIFVPLVGNVAGVTPWGVPFVAGEPLSWARP